MSDHTHHALRSYERGYRGPVSRDENRAAHGGITNVETCACGATRETNLNGNHTEEGEWYLDS